MAEPRAKQGDLGENESLAMRAKEGDREASAALWERVHKLIIMLLSKYFPMCPQYNVEPDDLIQSGYFAMLRAVEAYDPEKEFRFTSYLNLNVQNVAKEDLGLRGHKTRPRNVRSLDEPIPGMEGDGVALADTIPDEGAAEAFEDVERDVYRQQLHDTLEECLDALPEAQADTIRARFYRGLTFKEVAALHGVSIEYTRQTERKALTALRHPRITRKLAAFRDDIIQCHSFRGVGWTAFNSTQASSVERTVERLEMVENRLMLASDLGKSRMRAHAREEFIDTIPREQAIR